MKLKLKVFDPTIKEMTMGDKIHKNILIKNNNNDRWNKEIEKSRNWYGHVAVNFLDMFTTK